MDASSKGPLAIYWTKVDLTDFPDDLTRLEDLEGAILEVVDVLASAQYEAAKCLLRDQFSLGVASHLTAHGRR